MKDRKALAVRRASEKCWIENKAMLYVFDLRLGVAQRVKPLPTMQETRVQSLGQEDPLKKEMATHSSTLVWKIPWMEEPVGSQSRTQLSDFTSLGDNKYIRFC